MSPATVALGLTLAPAAFAAGHGGGGFAGHVGGFGGHVGIHGGHTGVFGGEHAVGGEHALVGGQTLGGQAFGGHSFDSGLLADGRHDLGDGIFVGDGSIAGNHLMYGRVPRFGRGGVFLGYDYPDPSLCYQYPEY